jgi:serine/threonine-protein kinase RsbW
MAMGYELKDAAEPQSLDRIHDLLQRMWDEDPAVDLMDRIRFETAVIEVASNIIEHGTAATAEPIQFRLELENTGERLCAQFQDNARPAGVDLSSAAMPADMSESGRGLALAKVALDQFAYERDGSSNRWTLVCRRSGPAD